MSAAAYETTEAQENSEQDENIQLLTSAEIDEIEIGQRHRSSGDTRQLELSIREYGLLNPVILRMNPDYLSATQEEVDTGIKPYILVAGLNRVQAFKNLNLESIPASVRNLDEASAEILEIDENLARIDLSTLERSIQLKRRQELYNQKHGIVPGKPAKDDTGKHVKRFDEDAAEIAGMSSSSVREAVSLAKKLDPEAADKLKGTHLENNRAELSRLAGIDQQFHTPLAELLAANDKMTVEEASIELHKMLPGAPEAKLETPLDKFEKNILASEGKIRYAERLLREDIQINDWSRETQIDLRDHLYNIQDTLEKIVAKFNDVLD